jgi:BlaI family penicillinase repressor
MKLTDLEFKIIKIIWKLNEKATIYDIINHWEEEKKPGYTTILKMLQIMERKKIVIHEKTGRHYSYMPLINFDQYLQDSINSFNKTYFNGQNFLFANALIAQSTFSKQELLTIKELIAQKEQELKKVEC